MAFAACVGRASHAPGTHYQGLSDPRALGAAILALPQTLLYLGVGCSGLRAVSAGLTSSNSGALPGACCTPRVPSVCHVTACCCCPLDSPPERTPEQMPGPARPERGEHCHLTRMVCVQATAGHRPCWLGLTVSEAFACHALGML